MRFALNIRLILVMAVITAFALNSGIALAHETRDVGKYRVVVGFIVEPAFEGLKNGVDLRVTNTETQKPVEGLETTLQVEITHVPSKTSKTFALRTIFRDPGHYTADLIATAPGVYQMRFFGSVEGTAVNETFVSRGGGGGFNDMASSADLQFPERLPEIRELAGAIRGSQAIAQEARDVALRAQDRASSANTLAVTGIVLGAVGIAAAGFAMVALRRR